MKQERRKRIEVTENEGIFRVAADFRNGFNLVPVPMGRLSLAFWDEHRLKTFLRNYGFYPVIVHERH